MFQASGPHNALLITESSNICVSIITNEKNNHGIADKLENKLLNSICHSNVQHEISLRSSILTEIVNLLCALTGVDHTGAYMLE